MGRTSRQIRRATALALVGVLLLPVAAHADGFGATAEVGYTNGTLTVTDATGRSTTTHSNLLPQRYRLSFDKQFYPFLILNAAGLYNWTPGWNTTDGIETTTETHRWNVFASLLVGPPILNATPYYIRRQEFGSIGAGGGSFRSPTLVNQAYGVYAGWNPAGLPLLNLRVGHNENFDGNREFQDTVSDEIIFNASYLEVENLALRYTLRWSKGSDRLNGVQTTDLNQGAQVSWSGSFFERRLNTSVNYTVGYRTGTVESSGSGTVSIQQFPVGGLSLVELFPSIPSVVTLLPNPALIDGDLLASAGIDIGFGPSLAGDQNLRDMGVAFANGTTEVNALRLWVDRQLPPSVAGAYAFTAWSSDDNLSWTQVPVTGPVTFGVFENRFEIPIVRTQARYLKVVTRPITTAVTSDPQYRAVLVTELQPFLVVPASEAPRTSQQWGGNFNGSARLLLLQDWNLAYTLGFNTSHEGSLDFRDWSVLNALSAGRQVAPGVSVNAQISRTDSAQTNLPHEATNRWSAQIGYDPYQTLGLSFTYSGQYGQLFQGDVLSNSVTLVARADPWQGVSLAATGGYTWARDAAGRRLESPNASVGITLVPMQALTISGTWGVSSSIVTGTGGPVRGESTSSLQGSLSFTPVRAIYFTAGILRSSGGGMGPQTLLNFGGGFSPFTGGQLLIRFGYDESVDTLSRIRNRFLGPSLRWNIRTGTYLDVAYTWNDTFQPALLTQSRTLFANLFISFL